MGWARPARGQACAGHCARWADREGGGSGRRQWEHPWGPRDRKPGPSSGGGGVRLSRERADIRPNHRIRRPRRRPSHRRGGSGRRRRPRARPPPCLDAQLCAGEPETRRPAPGTTGPHARMELTPDRAAGQHEAASQSRRNLSAVGLLLHPGFVHAAAGVAARPEARGEHARPPPQRSRTAASRRRPRTGPWLAGLESVRISSRGHRIRAVRQHGTLTARSLLRCGVYSVSGRWSRMFVGQKGSRPQARHRTTMPGFSVFPCSSPAASVDFHFFFPSRSCCRDGDSE